MNVPEHAIPIIFSSSMTLALRAGRKTETRRPMKPQPRRDQSVFVRDGGGVQLVSRLDPTESVGVLVECPWPKGSILWCRERLDWTEIGGVYHADGLTACDDNGPIEWRWQRKSLPAIHMPKAVCRTLVRVLGSRAERLRSMTERSVAAEGFDTIDDFRALWNELHADEPDLLFERDPVVWRVRFEIAEIDG